VLIIQIPKLEISYAYGHIPTATGVLVAGRHEIGPAKTNILRVTRMLKRLFSSTTVLYHPRYLVLMHVC
jgi:hypothetical protein